MYDSYIWTLLYNHLDIDKVYKLTTSTIYPFINNGTARLCNITFTEQMFSNKTK